MVKHYELKTAYDSTKIAVDALDDDLSALQDACRKRSEEMAIARSPRWSTGQQWLFPHSVSLSDARGPGQPADRLARHQLRFRSPRRHPRHGTGACYGEAAGIAAALAIKDGQVRGVALAELQARLRAHGQFVEELA
jgi:hypothetical protein